MAGADVIFDRESSKWRRIGWTTLLIVCIALLAAQVVERVRHFMKEPISVEVKVHRNNTLKFPAVTICNKNWFNLTRARRLLEEVYPGNNCTDEQLLRDDLDAGDGCTVSDAIGRRPPSPSSSTTAAASPSSASAEGQQAALNAADVWRRAAHNFSELVQQCYFGRNVTCERAGIWSEIVTEMGICQTFQTNEPVKTSGHFNHLYIVLNDNQKKFRNEEGFRVLIHDPGDDPRLMVRTHGSSIVQKHGRDVRMVLKEFKAIPSRDYFCREEDDGYSHIGCEAHCFNTILYREAGCLLPFMTHTPGLSGAAICNTREQYRSAIWHKQNLLHSGGWNAQDNCTCERKCHEFEFLLFAETTEIDDSRARLRVFYQDLYYENVQESLAYPVIPLLCDLGGALGLMLGASLLTFFEIVEAVVMHVFRLYRCRARQDGATVSGCAETTPPPFGSQLRPSWRRSRYSRTGSGPDTDFLGVCHELEPGVCHELEPPGSGGTGRGIRDRPPGSGGTGRGIRDRLRLPGHTGDDAVFR